MAIEENDVIALAERLLTPATLAEVGRAMSLRRGVALSSDTEALPPTPGD
jgi:hypothetical protein